MTTESFWKKTAETLNNRCLELEGELAQMTKWRDGAVADANENHQKYVERKKQVLRTLYGGSVRAEELKADNDYLKRRVQDLCKDVDHHAEQADKWRNRNRELVTWVDGCTNWLGEHCVYWLKLLRGYGLQDGNSTSYHGIKQIHDAYHFGGVEYPWQED
jgi:hypothetical protein